MGRPRRFFDRIGVTRPADEPKKPWWHYLLIGFLVAILSIPIRELVVEPLFGW